MVTVDRLVDPPPLGVVGLQLVAAALGLLGGGDGGRAGVDDEGTTLLAHDGR